MKRVKREAEMAIKSGIRNQNLFGEKSCQAKI
jgi:hypothetical protein